MLYELRINGRKLGQYDDPDDALACARAFTRNEPDFEVEILDTRTGRAFEPAASIRWRDELATKIGY